MSATRRHCISLHVTCIFPGISHCASPIIEIWTWGNHRPGFLVSTSGAPGFRVLFGPPDLWFLGPLRTQILALLGWSHTQVVEEGEWSVRLALSALDLVDKNDDEGYAAAAQAAGGLELLKAGAGEGSSVFLIEFADGFRAALLHAQGGFVSSW